MTSCSRSLQPGDRGPRCTCHVSSSCTSIPHYRVHPFHNGSGLSETCQLAICAGVSQQVRPVIIMKTSRPCLDVCDDVVIPLKRRVHQERPTSSAHAIGLPVVSCFPPWTILILLLTHPTPPIAHPQLTNVRPSDTPEVPSGDTFRIFPSTTRTSADSRNSRDTAESSLRSRHSPTRRRPFAHCTVDELSVPRPSRTTQANAEDPASDCGS